MAASKNAAVVEETVVDVPVKKKTGKDSGVENYEFSYKESKEAKSIDLGHGRTKILVWQLPVRLWHWLNALSIVLLMVTGLYIGNPIFSPVENGNADQFVMGWARIIHFVSAFVFMIGLLVRIYWAFVGNKYTRFSILRKGFWSGLWETIKFYLFLPNKKPHYIGHNPLAQLAYWVIFGGCSILLSLTGLFLFTEPQRGSVLESMFSWIGWLFGGSFTTRSIHHWAAWGVVVFVVLHIYLAIREDYLARNGTMSSIFSGYKIDKKKNQKGETNAKKTK